LQRREAPRYYLLPKVQEDEVVSSSTQITLGHKSISGQVRMLIPALLISILPVEERAAWLTVHKRVMLTVLMLMVPSSFTL
jgi:hypothetical protein